jgi:hypothetical protein
MKIDERHLGTILENNRFKIMYFTQIKVTVPIWQESKDLKLNKIK